MMRGFGWRDDGLTGLELVILLFVIVAGASLVLIALGSGMPDLSRTFPGGLVAESVYMSGDHIGTVGSVYGFSHVSGRPGSVVVIYPEEDQSRLGAVRFVVSLFMGSTGAIDMDRVTVQWNNVQGSEVLRRSASGTLVCPNWTISNKYNLLPGRTADSDDWLEPREQFELTICSARGAYPKESFAINLQPDGVAMPLTVRRMVPSLVRPVMNLG